MTALPTIRGDFNSVRDDVLAVSLKDVLGDARMAIEEGNQVRILDGDGNECLGWVLRVSANLARVKLDWSTWVSERQVSETQIAAG